MMGAAGGGIPTILLACGSFSPVTYLHLRLFEQARDFLREHRPDLDIIAGVLSPVHDDYKKQGLARAQDRLAMTRLAVQSSDWLCVDDWECRASGWSRTAVVLQHIEAEANRDNHSASAAFRPGRAALTRTFMQTHPSRSCCSRAAILFIRSTHPTSGTRKMYVMMRQAPMKHRSRATRRTAATHPEPPQCRRH